MCRSHDQKIPSRDVPQSRFFWVPDCATPLQEQAPEAWPAWTGSSGKLWGGGARDSSVMSPRVPRTRYSNSSRMPSEQCAEESVRRDVHCTVLPRQETQVELVLYLTSHESRRLVGVRAWLVGIGSQTWPSYSSPNPRVNNS
jgi:hypothetical protein